MPAPRGDKKETSISRRRLPPQNGTLVVVTGTSTATARVVALIGPFRGIVQNHAKAQCETCEYVVGGELEDKVSSFEVVVSSEVAWSVVKRWSSRAPVNAYREGNMLCQAFPAHLGARNADLPPEPSGWPCRPHDHVPFRFPGKRIDDGTAIGAQAISQGHLTLLFSAFFSRAAHQPGRPAARRARTRWPPPSGKKEHFLGTISLGPRNDQGSPIRFVTPHMPRPSVRPGRRCRSKGDAAAATSWTYNRRTTSHLHL